MNIKDDTIQYFLKIITLVFGILLLFNIVNAIGYFVNEHRNAHPSEMKVKVDTLFVYDTIFIEKPVIKKVEIIDTLLLPVPITDTLMLHDTVLVHLPSKLYFTTFFNSSYVIILYPHMVYYFLSSFFHFNII